MTWNVTKWNFGQEISWKFCREVKWNFWNKMTRNEKNEIDESFTPLVTLVCNFFLNVFFYLSFCYFFGWKAIKKNKPSLTGEKVSHYTLHELILTTHFSSSFFCNNKEDDIFSSVCIRNWVGSYYKLVAY